jgi:hypothetical protein
MMARPFKLIFLTILGISLVVISQIGLARMAQAGIKPARQTNAKVTAGKTSLVFPTAPVTDTTWDIVETAVQLTEATLNIAGEKPDQSHPQRVTGFRMLNWA